MDLTILTPLSSTSTPHRLFFPSRLEPPSLSRSRRRCRVSPPRNSSDPPSIKTLKRIDPSIFLPVKDVSGPKSLFGSLPPPARVASSLILTAAAAAAGFGIGFRFGGSRAAGIGGAAVIGAAGGAAVLALSSSVPEVAAANLHNLVAGFDDPMGLKREDVDGIEQKYGVSKQDEAFRVELCDLYSRFVTSVIPPGAENLRGDEVEMIIKFKAALGIDDPEAASVHMEIGRRIFRQRLETGDREADVEQRRAFQKLVYVSTLVFGEASKFLLPWKRIFKVTDAQVDIAVRDNAQRLYALKLNSIGKGIEEKQLFDLREAQLLYKLSDELASEMFRQHTRKLAEENISKALDILNWAKATGTVRVSEELETVLQFNDLLTQLSKHPEAGRFPPGVGPISLLGGEYDNDRKTDDLKLLYRAYVTECFPDGCLEETKLVPLNHLKNIFSLGKSEAEAILLDIASKVYRRRLLQARSGGDLEAAPSKAAFLQNLCDELHFDPQKASEIHEEIYRQKLRQSVSNGELSEEDVAALLRVRVLLCIPQQTVDAAHVDICGSLFEKVVRDAIASGVQGYDADARATVRKASQGLRLTKEAAMASASKAVRKVFMNYVQLSKSADNRTESAKELKKMIEFNELVVTELISDIKGESATEPVEPVEDEPKQMEEEEEWESLETLRKTRPNKEQEAKLRKPGQTEITLKDDLSERDKAELYRIYLHSCLQEEVKVLPLGLHTLTKKDSSEYLLLNQLGGILGLTGNEIVEISRNMAEQTFTKRAKEILADGQLTKAKIDQLNDVQKQVGLPAEYVQKVIKNITTTKMAVEIETAVSQGRIGIQQVRELKKASIDLDTMISERLRENLLKKTVEEIFSSGTGMFDEEEVYEKIPADLNIDAQKAKIIVQDLAKSRLSNSLVQAVALLRQRTQDGVVSSLNDMLACDMAVPAEPLSWSSPDELADLYLIYLKGIPKPENLTRLQYLLGISDSTAAVLQDTAKQGDSPLETQEEEFVF